MNVPQPVVGARPLPFPVQSSDAADRSLPRIPSIFRRENHFAFPEVVLVRLFELEPCRDRLGACCEPDACRTNLCCARKGRLERGSNHRKLLCPSSWKLNQKGSRTHGLRRSAAGGVLAAADDPFDQTTLGSYDDQDAEFHTFMRTLSSGKAQVSITLNDSPAEDLNWTMSPYLCVLSSCCSTETSFTPTFMPSRLNETFLRSSFSLVL